MHPAQSGFRKHHSCQTTLTNLTDKWLNNINNNQFTGVIFADFAKAFDLIDHELLLRKLALYNLSENSLALIRSFLSNRQQKVVIQNQCSLSKEVKLGVPQGSILGPLLFCLYVNDLPLHVSTPCELFADDTTSHVSNSCHVNLARSSQNAVDELLGWGELNHMALSSLKTKQMIVTTRQKRQNIESTMPKIYIKTEEIEEVNSHKVLGVIIDNNLSWSNQLNDIAKLISKKVYQLSQIKHFLDIDMRKIFFNAHIQSIIDYSSTLWDGASNNSMKQLNCSYKRALKMILLKSSSLTQSDYKLLDILPLHLKLKYNKAVYMHRVVFGKAPPSIVNLFSTNNKRHNQKLVFPRPRIDLFKNSLQYSGGSLWNSLPKQLKEISSEKRFKKAIKDHLMESA